MRPETSRGAEESAAAETRSPRRSSDPIVVGVGASAGGLAAFSQLLEALPDHTGMAFVLVQHLDPDHSSLLAHLLSSKTAMPVTDAADGIAVAADHVYVIPPGSDLLIEGGRLRLRPRDLGAQPHLPIDAFLRSLAEDRGERAFGVVLSGAASDGEQGLAAIKAAGGTTFAQEPSSAEYSSMPLSAIRARVVDFILEPEEIASELARLAAGVGAEPPAARQVLDGVLETAALDQVFSVLHDSFHVDFSAYKLPTIKRRIARRMLLRRADDLPEYVTMLRDDPDEVGALYRDILIMVTEFFREPETFVVLRERVIPTILDGKGAGDDIRVWVPGCATGEEAYSLAITILDVMQERNLEAPVKIFATDISEPDLVTARRGSYPASASASVPPDLLRRYFVADGVDYRIAKAVRELCVFARHDVTSDPPFPNLDLVSCRNVLIYLGPGLQRWVIPSLHYGLRANGYLVLGRSESLAGFNELFEPLDKKQKIFRKLSPPSAAGVFRLRPAARGPLALSPSPAPPAGAPATPVSAARGADEAILAGFTPPGVTIDAQRNILEFRGDTKPYLTIPSGKPTLNLLDMARRDLRGKVRTVIAEAERTGAPARFRSVTLGKGKSRRRVDLHVIPFNTETGDTHFVVLFDDVSAVTNGSAEPSDEPSAVELSETERLRDEVSETRERLEAVIQDKEAANEELRAANEELLSSAEEMQSVNEELETTHEELRSTNEELRSRNVELGQVSDDLSNLLTSISFPIIMVGRDLRIRRFTPAAVRLLKVIPSDVGRLITDLRLCIDVPDLEQILTDVIDLMTPAEREVQDDEGRWYTMQVRPYKTLDNRIDGAVLTLLDIDELKRVLAAQRIVESALRESEARFKIAAEAAFLGVYDYDVAAGVITWDERARQVWGSREQQIGFDDFMTGVHPEDRAGARKAVDEAIDPTGEGRFRATFRVLDDAGVRWVSATGQVLFEEQQPLRLVGTLEDITERRYLEDSVRAAELAAAGQDERNRLARELHDSTTQALFAATLKAEALTTAYDPLPDRAAKTIEELRRLSRGALAQMRTLLLELHDEPLDEIPLEQLLRQLVEAVEGRVGTVTELSVRGAGELPSLVHVTVYRIVQEALNNVSKHADAANAWVLVDLEPGRLHLTVEDDGRGFDPAAVDPGHFGLRSMQERAAEAGAELKIGPRPGGGTVVQVDWTAAADPVV